MEGKIIGQCKNCYDFGVVKDAKTVTYRGKGKRCHTLRGPHWGMLNGTDDPEFGCWYWKPRPSLKRKKLSLEVLPC